MSRQHWYLLTDYASFPQVASPYQGQHDLCEEPPEYRDVFLRNVLAALNHHDHPAAQVQSLSIQNMQDMINKDIATSADFKAVISRLQSLDLCVATECNSLAPDSEIYMEERHEFFAQDLKKCWLEPLQEQLRHLKICMYAQSLRYE